MTNIISKSGLNFLFSGEANVTASSDRLTNAAAVLRSRDETAGDVRDVMSGSPARKSESPSQYRFVSQPPPPPSESNVIDLDERRPPSSTKAPEECAYPEKEPSSSSMRTIRAAFNGLHPVARSCIARLVDCADNSFDFYQLYQALRDTPYGQSTRSSSLSSNILLLTGLSTLLDGKVIALPMLASGNPSLHKKTDSPVQQKWQIVNCTDESLDVGMPRVRVARIGTNPNTSTLIAVPLDVLFFFNKPY